MRETSSNLVHLLGKVLCRAGRTEPTRRRRLNLRRKAKGLLRRINNAINTEFPVIDKEGKELRNGNGWKCPWCDKWFRSQTVLGRHFAYRHNPKHHSKNGIGIPNPFYWTCVCNSRFKRATALGKHLVSKHAREHVVAAVIAGEQNGS